MSRIDSLSLTIPPRHTFSYSFCGETGTETDQLPPYAVLCRGTVAHWYWKVTRSSMRRLFRAMEMLAEEDK